MIYGVSEQETAHISCTVDSNPKVILSSYHHRHLCHDNDNHHHPHLIIIAMIIITITIMMMIIRAPFAGGQFLLDVEQHGRARRDPRGDEHRYGRRLLTLLQTYVSGLMMMTVMMSMMRMMMMMVIKSKPT